MECGAVVDLSIIIVSYKSVQYLPRCLKSIIETAGPLTYEIIVVDNASNDGSRELLGSQFPQAKTIINETNLGFARAVNRGAVKAQGRILLLLNPDTQVQEGALTKSVQFLDQNPDIGIVGARINNPNGTLQRACRRSIPTPQIAFFRLSGLGKVWTGHPAARAYNLEDADPDRQMDVEAVSGSYLMVRRTAFDQAGAMDERYFLYGEDLDICLAVSRAGYRIVYYPKAVIIHYKGASSGQANRLANREFHRAMSLFHKKHFCRQDRRPLELAHTRQHRRARMGSRPG